MFGMGWTEILLIGIVALIVVGPKELPGLFRNVGQFMGRAKGMAREFTRAMEDAADQSGVKDASDSFKGLTDPLKGLSNPKKYGLDKVKEAADISKPYTSAGSGTDKTNAAGTKSGSSTQSATGSATGQLSAERAEASRKIQESAAQAATKRMEAEAQARAAETAAAAETVQPAAQTLRQTPASRASGHRAAKPVNRPVSRGKSAPRAKSAPTKKG